MRKVLSFVAVSAICSTLAFAESYSGKLVDAGCYAKQQSSTGCDATSATKAFALDVSGKIFNLDPAGNDKVSTAVKNRADRVADPTKPQSKSVMAKVEGTEKDGMIVIDSIEVQ